MSVELVRRKAQKTIFSLGRTALHAISPDDFELYVCTFELINSQGTIEDIFHFPMMPSAISIGRQSLVNVRKSGAGYLSQFNNSFVSNSISINGTFGKKFRLMISNGIGRNINNKEESHPKFDLKVKTGYGALKLMEKIIKESQKLDEFGQPRFLVFHNYTFNHSHVVEVMNFNVQQSVENNMMWNYTMELKTLAPSSALYFDSNNNTHLAVLLAMTVLNKAVNTMFDNISVEGIESTDFK